MKKLASLLTINGLVPTFGNGRRNNDGNFQNGNIIPARAKPFSDSKITDLGSVAPQCFVCVMERSYSHHKVANCQRFRRMNP